jgi:hypothetical protein
MAGRVGVRDTLYQFLANPPIENLNVIHTSFPKRIQFQENGQAGQLTRSQAIIFIQSENETRLAIGGATNGWKRVDYSVIVQIYTHSLQPDARMAMADFDTLVDAIKIRLRSDHNFGDESGTLVWQGAEPIINGSYGEPATTNEGATEIYAELQFDVTEMIQA